MFLIVRILWDRQSLPATVAVWQWNVWLPRILQRNILRKPHPQKKLVTNVTALHSNFNIGNAFLPVFVADCSYGSDCCPGTKIDPCFWKVCWNNGFCEVNERSGRPECVCEAGFGGDDCSIGSKKIYKKKHLKKQTNVYWTAMDMEKEVKELLKFV